MLPLPAVAQVPPDHIRIHYHRPDGNYSGWTVYSWNSSAEPNDYIDGPKSVTSADDYGAFFDIRLITNPSELDFIVHNISTGAKDPGPDMHLPDVVDHPEAWVISGDATVYTARPTAEQILAGGFSRLQAFWIDRGTVAIQAQYLQDKWNYALAYAPNANLRISSDGKLGNASTIALSLSASGFTAAQSQQYPQLTGYAAFKLPSNASMSMIEQALKSQLALAATDSTGVLKYLTGVQNAGALDDLFHYSGPLGPVFNELGLNVSVWAPTAQTVKLRLYDGATDANPTITVAMTESGGVWTAIGESSWEGKYYLFEVRVYIPSLHQIADNIVTDPYSADLALNGIKTRITNLRSGRNKPEDWDGHASPYLRSKNDISIYELHVRDFSTADASVPSEHRGTYLAFVNPETDGMRHLRRLADAGLKAVHLLPTFHFASVNEEKSTWQSPGDLSVYPPDSGEQQTKIASVQTMDDYNWGYDPVHYLAPEGSYAHNPDERVREYRGMVLSLHKAGLRVIQDVVFNHTATSGQAPNSVLDKIVPGYYYRLDADGNVENATCCADTASEHKMMEKLMIDAVMQNAREYKIDGFRFDLMGFHFVYNMQHIQKALSQLTPEKDGIDGSRIYLYGEGWNFGETANNALGPNADQVNMYGIGIGTFNDRIRDGIRGGNGFSDQRVQGFATGLFTDSSLYTNQNQSTSDQRSQLLFEADWIRTGLAGSLRDYTFVNSAGQTVRASQIDYGGQGAGSTAAPIEGVNYCSAHDNQTLFDAIQLKAAIPGTVWGGGDDLAARTRRQVLAMSLIALAQGVPFFLAGDDILRSKDMDNNSFDSGDWFNKIDWTYNSANWGIGLPIASQNQNQWTIMQPLLANPVLTPSRKNILHARDAFEDFLRIRESSRLFRMEILAEIQNNLHFLNTGPQQIPGLIVMKLDGNGGDYGAYQHILVVFNATLSTVQFQDDSFKDLGLHLHIVQVNSSDDVVRQSSLDGRTGTASVAGLTTAVFVS
jgi:pullulanase